MAHWSIEWRNLDRLITNSLMRLQMNDKIKERLTTLKNDFENGQLQLIKLQDKQEELEQQLYRLAGAIQVLEDLLQESKRVAEV